MVALVFQVAWFFCLRRKDNKKLISGAAGCALHLPPDISFFTYGKRQNGERFADKRGRSASLSGFPPGLQRLFLSVLRNDQHFGGFNLVGMASRAAFAIRRPCLGYGLC